MCIRPSSRPPLVVSSSRPWHACSQPILLSTPPVSKGCSQRRFTGEDLAERGTSAERWRRHFPRSPGSWSATASHPGAGSKVELWALPPAFIPFRFCAYLSVFNDLRSKVARWDRSHIWSPYHLPSKVLKSVKFLLSHTSGLLLSIPDYIQPPLV